MTATLIPQLPISVATIADLATSRARTAAGQIVQTSGYTTPGDGGGGSYIYRTSGRSQVTLNGFFIAGPGVDDYFEATNKLEANAIAWGCDPSGNLDCSEILVAATAALPAGGAIVFPAGLYIFTQDCSIGHCVFKPGAVLMTSGSGVDVEIDRFTASDTQRVFDVSAGGTFTIVNRHPVTAENWGAVPDGVTDSSEAVQAAINATKNVKFLAGRYICTVTCNPDNGPVMLVGNNTFLTAVNSNEFALTLTGEYANGVCRVSNITFYGDNPQHGANPGRSKHGLLVNIASNLFLDNCWFEYCDLALVNQLTIITTYSALVFNQCRVGAYYTARTASTDTLDIVTPLGQEFTLPDPLYGVGHPAEALIIGPRFSLCDIGLVIDSPGNEWAPSRDFKIDKPLFQYCKVGLLMLPEVGGWSDHPVVVNSPWCEGQLLSGTVSFNGVTYQACDVYNDGCQHVQVGGWLQSIRGRSTGNTRLENVSWTTGGNSDYDMFDMQDSAGVTGEIVYATGRIPFPVRAGVPLRSSLGPIFSCPPMIAKSYTFKDSEKLVYSKNCEAGDVPLEFGGTELGIINDGPSIDNSSYGYACTPNNGVLFAFNATVDTQYVSKFALKAYCPEIEFTADHTTETFTAVGHGLLNGQEMNVRSSGTLPTGLLADTSYYIINKTDDTFQLSETVGGTAYAITGNGSGTHIIHQVHEFELRTQNYDQGAFIGSAVLPTSTTWKTWCINGLTPSTITSPWFFISPVTTSVVRAFLVSQVFVLKVDNFAESLEIIDSQVFLSNTTPTNVEGPSPFARANHTGVQSSSTISDFRLSVLELVGSTDYSDLLLTARSLLNGDANSDGTADANDLIGTYNGTWNGTPAYGLSAVYTGKSFALDGTNYITQASAAGAIPGNVTIAAWVKCNTLAGRIVSKRNDTDSPFEVFVNSNGSVSFFDGALATSNTGLITPGVWHHVAVTLRPGDFRGDFWVDGVSAGDEFIYTPNTNSELVNWGRLPAFGGLDYLDGELYQCAIWNSLLTSDQINLLYRTELAQPAAVTSTQLDDEDNAVNTTKKYAGKVIFNVTTSKPVWATGPLNTDTWVDATGTVAHTPS